MGVEKIKRGVDVGGASVIRGSLTVKGQTLSPSTAIQSITLSGVSTSAAGTAIRTGTHTALITSTGTGAGHEVSLAATRAVGSRITVAVACESTVPVTLLLESTAQVLFGSTANAVVFSTNSSGASVTLQKVSTTAYAVTNVAALSTSSRPTFTGSTGTV